MMGKEKCDDFSRKIEDDRKKVSKKSERKKRKMMIKVRKRSC